MQNTYDPETAVPVGAAIKCDPKLGSLECRNQYPNVQTELCCMNIRAVKVQENLAED